MRHTSGDTRERLLKSAINEFAAHGLSGARTKQIAASAEVNEALVFRYFGDKSAMFDAAFGRAIADTLDAVPLTADDLPGYVGRLFDYYQQDRTLVRLAVWAGLQRPQAPHDDVETSFRAKSSAIAAAQRAGVVSDALPSDELLALLVHLSLSASDATAGMEPHPDRARRRQSVVLAAHTLTTPTAPPPTRA